MIEEALIVDDQQVIYIYICILSTHIHNAGRNDRDAGSDSRRPAGKAYFLLCTSCILHPASCILHPASCILHPAPCTLHRVLPAACCLLPAACCLLPAASRMDDLYAHAYVYIRTHAYTWVHTHTHRAHATAYVRMQIHAYTQMFDLLELFESADFEWTSLLRMSAITREHWCCEWKWTCLHMHMSRWTHGAIHFLPCACTPCTHDACIMNI